MIIDLHRAAEWLSERSWSPSVQVPSAMWEWRRVTAMGQYAVELPLNYTLRDYARRVDEAVNCIVIAEGCTAEEVRSAIMLRQSDGELVAELATTRAALVDALDAADRWRQACDAAKAETMRAREDSGRHLLMSDILRERSIRAEGEVVGWMSAFDRLVLMLKQGDE